MGLVVGSKYLWRYAVLLVVLVATASFAESEPELKKLKHFDTSLSFEERTLALIEQMSAAEKVSQLTHDAVGIPRLGIPRYNWWNESLHGLAFSGKATVFPQPVGLAASFNEQLLFDIGVAISDEARAKHHAYIKQDKREIFQGLNFFAPNINIFRDPRWGRGSETYGEDPWLTSRLGVAYIKGMQGDDPKYIKVGATAKHYAVHSGPEATRHSFNSIVGDKDLYETYLPQFKAAVEEANVYSVMGAYNRVNGASASGDPRLLTEILRDEWGFDGFVVSDCWAVLDIYEHHKIAWSPESATEIALKSGDELNCGNYYKDHLLNAYKQGLVDDKDLDLAVYRTMLLRFKLGMFDDEAMVPWAALSESVINSEKNQQLALQAAKESIVLLKNDTKLLPLDENKLNKVAVVGPNANQIEALLGNYHGLPFQYSTPLKGVEDYLAGKAEVLYAHGSNWNDAVTILEELPASWLSTLYQGKKQQGLLGHYYANNRLEGNPDGRLDQESSGAEIIYENKPVLTRVDDVVSFDWDDGAPAENLPDDFFSVLWQGQIEVPESGSYLLGAEGHNKFKIYINDKLHAEHYEGYHENIKVAKPYEFKAGKTYKIKVEFEAHTGAANFRLMWAKTDKNLIEEALTVAKQSDVVLVFAGLTPRLEAEGYDRTSIELPSQQQDLIKALVKTGKPVVLVMLNGGHLALNWEKENVAAIVEAWYPGQAAGQAIAEVLFGRYNPSGRLPLTFVKSLDELPHFGNYSMKGRTYRYAEHEALWPFAWGLSYSQFNYSNLQIPKKIKRNKDLVVEVDISNSSDRDGTEVVQLYLKNLTVSDGQPLHSLKAVKRVHIKAGESKRVHIELDANSFIFFNDDGEEVLEKGRWKITVGGSQPGLTPASTGSISKEIKLK
ncbi:glycoside hydrolase family 3 C-terminal domain-containing protein [Agaribacterium sp. ZY112]|uniref:glycoside hydrolase family 3 C-terminal domain-containing protein n=1 Tax=Agaribacterium sp. ZY112 TaxID=3233574 RepID=UPI00352557ED